MRFATGYKLDLPPTQQHHQSPPGLSPFLVGNPYKPLLVMVVTGWGVDPGSKSLVVLFLQMYLESLMTLLHARL